VQTSSTASLEAHHIRPASPVPSDVSLDFDFATPYDVSTAARPPGRRPDPIGQAAPWVGDPTDTETRRDCDDSSAPPSPASEGPEADSDVEPAPLLDDHAGRGDQPAEEQHGDTVIGSALESSSQQPLRRGEVAASHAAGSNGMWQLPFDHRATTLTAQQQPQVAGVVDHAAAD
jgi:hypothetical protein